jgi:hypothetical protein
MSDCSLDFPEIKIVRPRLSVAAENTLAHVNEAPKEQGT